MVPLGRTVGLHALAEPLATEEVWERPPPTWERAERFDDLPESTWQRLEEVVADDVDEVRSAHEQAWSDLRRALSELRDLQEATRSRHGAQ